jgi:hypothetical protein
MKLRSHLLVCATAVGFAGGTVMPAAAAPWVRGFVVGTYEYAFHYGGRSDYSRGAEIEPGVDCPHGSTIHFANDTQTRIAVARQPWRSQQEIDWIAKPPGLDNVKAPVLTRFHIWNRAVAYRGYRRGIETYVNPWAADDPGEPEVTGRISDGFNLDGKIKPVDFVSPDGEKGVDNNLYRAWGCDAPWRGNNNATLDLRANDKMQDGLYTMVIRVSGNQDPMNDSDATVEIGYSPDKIVKDAKGNVAADYSYRILQPAEYTKLKAKIKNGVVESEQVPEMHAPRIAWFYDQTGDADFHQGRLRLKMSAEGSGTGLLGGYRDWRDLYVENTFAQDGGQQGIREHEDHVALYFALKRNADGMYDPATGQNMGISTAYRVTLSRAYVVDPDKPMDIPILVGDLKRKKAFEAIRTATIKGIANRTPQGVPPGTSEAAVPSMERDIADLPSKDFFLKTLDRPHYPGGDRDERGRAVDPQGNPIQPAQPQRQVRNDAPATVTAAQGQ